MESAWPNVGEDGAAMYDFSNMIGWATDDLTEFLSKLFRRSIY